MQRLGQKKILTSGEWRILLLGISIILGSVVRFMPGLMAGFPLNDGGMFLSMIQDLRESHYVLPAYTSYNGLSIPFAYPPFGFYFARLISDVFSVPELSLLRWLPPFVNSFSILVFYLLASELLKSKPLGALASAFYALTPGAFGWFVMGGGLTRSFGSLFLLLTIYFAFQLFQCGGKKFIVLSTLFGGLTILSHPEAGMHAVAICFLSWLIFGRTVKSFISAFVVGIGVFLFTSPWWRTVFFYHGWTPVISALHTGMYGAPLGKALLGLLMDGSTIPILAVLRWAGLAWGVWRKQIFLLCWIFLPYFVEPRSAPSVAFYPITMLTALAFGEAIPWLIRRFWKFEIRPDELYKSVLYNTILFTMLILLFIDSGLFGFRLVGNSLNPADVNAMNWVRENAPDDAIFLVLTGIPSPEVDPFVEWFPALAERRNQTTIQGYEWLLGEDFYKRYSDLSELQQCTSVGCVEKWSESTGLGYDHVAIFNYADGSMAGMFQDNPVYQEIYSSNKVVVFGRAYP